MRVTKRIDWKPWQDDLIRQWTAEGKAPHQIADRLGYARKTVLGRMEVLRIERPAKPPAPKLAKYTYSHDEELLQYHAQGKRPEEMAFLTGRTKGSVINRLCLLLAKRAEDVFTDRAHETRNENIVSQAEHILRKAGFAEMRLKVMSLDDRMREANAILFRHHYPQLGRKPEWLHK